MIAKLIDEVREVAKHKPRQGMAPAVMWCPFCDTSVTEGFKPACTRCGAVYSELPLDTWMHIAGSFDSETGEKVVGITLLPDAHVDMPDTTGPVTVKPPPFPRVMCEVEGCEQLVSTMPAAQATHRKKHERASA